MAHKSKGSAQILIVEDNPSIQYLMRLLIGKEGHWQPTVVGDGASALRAWSEGSFDVILMDIGLPDMPGTDVARTIREMERTAGKRSTPIIAFSGNLADERQKKCFEVGMNDYIVKADNVKTVIHTIYRHLDTSLPRLSVELEKR